MDEFVIYHVPREENPRANALAQQASSYNVRKRNFQEHKLLLTDECFALEAPVMPTQPTGLTGDTSLTDATERSDRSLRFGPVHGTSLTDGHDRSDRSLIKIPLRFFMKKMRWRIGENLWLNICIILAVQLIEKFDDGS
jgi:hypothetical protein